MSEVLLNSRLGIRVATDTSSSTADAGYLTISEVCQELGVTHRTVRFYEAQGLVAPKRGPRRRFYYTTDVERLRAIMRLKSVRLSLREIRELLQHRAMELWADRQLVRASSGLACSAPGQKQGSRFLLRQVVGARHELRPSWRPRRHLAQPLAAGLRCRAGAKFRHGMATVRQRH